MQCPSCTRPLTPIEYEGVSLHACEGCGGEFVSASALTHIINVRDERFGDEHHAALEGRRPEFGGRHRPAGPVRTCPECETAMQTGIYGGDTGILIDRCPSCEGVWLDRSELEHVQVLTELWSDEARSRQETVAEALEAGRAARRLGGDGFAASRFSFVNALINRILDAA